MGGRYRKRPATSEEILAARAQALAVAEAPEEPADRMAILAFCLEKEIYGIELRHTSAVHPLKEVTYIPGTPDFILGVINMRGEILSVVDLKKIFGLNQSTSERIKMGIILKNADMEFCLAADSIIGVRHIVPDEIAPSLPTLNGIRAEYLLGVAGDGMVILNGYRLLNAPEMRIDIDS